jgi:hypothetical protein
MIYLFLSLVLLIIGKFIYDSFLTNNTQKNWEEYKKENPHKAIVIENSKGLNMNPNAEIRTDGYYLAKYESLDYKGEPFTIYFFLNFTKKGFVAFSEIEDIDEWLEENNNETLKENIIEVNKIDEINYSPDATKFYIKNGGLTMKFFDPDEYSNKDENNLKTYDEWHGTIIHNGLLLSYDKAYFNNALTEYTKENRIKNLKFDFKQVYF